MNPSAARQQLMAEFATSFARVQAQAFTRWLMRCQGVRPRPPIVPRRLRLARARYVPLRRRAPVTALHCHPSNIGRPPSPSLSQRATGTRPSVPADDTRLFDPSLAGYPCVHEEGDVATPLLELNDVPARPAQGTKQASDVDRREPAERSGVGSTVAHPRKRDLSPPSLTVPESQSTTDAPTQVQASAGRPAPTPRSSSLDNCSPTNFVHR